MVMKKATCLTALQLPGVGVASRLGTLSHSNTCVQLQGNKLSCKAEKPKGQCKLCPVNCFGHSCKVRIKVPLLAMPIAKAFA